MTPTLALLLIIGVWVVIIWWLVSGYRARMNARPDQDHLALQDAAIALGLQPNGNNTYTGQLHGRRVRVAVEGGGGDKTGLRISVEDAASFDGVVRVSGPTEGGGAGYGEAKILIGDGPFDYYYWVARDKPRGTAKALLLPHDDALATMIDMPRGIWDFAGTTRTYHSYLVPPEDYQSVIQRAADVLSALS